MLDWLKDNGMELVAALMAALTLAEVVVRLTPTKKDDGVVERIGAGLRKALDVLGIPNRRKE